MKAEKKTVSSFRLPEKTWKAIRIRAIEEGRKFTDVIAQALDEYCAKPMKGESR